MFMLPFTKKTTGMMKNCMVARFVKQWLEMTPTESHNQNRMSKFQIQEAEKKLLEFA